MINIYICDNIRNNNYFFIKREKTIELFDR